MPSTRKISIKKNTDEDGEETSPRVVFDPVLCRVKKRTTIFWTNYDDEAHWPGRLLKNGTIVERYFMPEPVAPQDASPSWASPVKKEVTYACSLHRDEQDNPIEIGTIEVI